MQCLVEKKTGSRHSTFAELKQRGLRELRVFATDLNATEIVEHSAQCTPDVEVAEGGNPPLAPGAIRKRFQTLSRNRCASGGN